VAAVWVRAVFAAPPPFSPELERALGLLQYVSSDYAAAVSEAGKLVSPEEFDEQLELLQVIVAALAKQPDTRVRPLAAAARRLQADASKHVPPSQFKPRAQKLYGDMIRLFEVSLAPRTVPSLATGRILYRQNCVQCHGEDGRAETPHAKTLEPQPRNFLGPEAGERLSPYQVFNVLTFGVPGTAMASFETLEEAERWDLAFYVLSLRHSCLVPANGTAIPSPTLADLARVTDLDLQRRLQELPASERDALIARWRHAPPTTLGE
jgi:high-affinity iron transporter